MKNILYILLFVPLFTNAQTEFIEGCTYIEMFNYDIEATIDDGSCYPYIYGCTDVDALNYIPLIGNLYVDVNTSDAIDGEDGSCFVSDCCCLVEDLTTTCGWSLDLDCAAVSYCNVCDPCEILVVEGCTSPCFTEYNAEAEVDDGSCNNEIIFGCSCCVNSDGSWPLAAICGDQSTCYCDETYVCETGTLAIYGCVDPTYIEFNPDATVFDGSCYTVIIEGCTDGSACNFDVSANTDNDSCIYVENYYDCDGNCLSDTDGDSVCDEDEIVGCMDVTACDYNEVTTDIDNSLCTYAVTNLDCYGVCLFDEDGDGVCDELEVPGCTNASACNFDSLATENDLLCEYAADYYDCNDVCLIDTDGDGFCDELEIYGCTYSWAYNFEQSATEDDGSCIEVAVGCTDENAFNYDSTDGYIEINIGDVSSASTQCSVISANDNFLINFIVTDSISFSLFPSLRGCSGGCEDDGGCSGSMNIPLSLVKNGECQETSYISASYSQDCWIGGVNTSFVFKQFSLLSGSYSLIVDGYGYSLNEIEFAVNYNGAIPEPFGWDFDSFDSNNLPALGLCSDYLVCSDPNYLEYYLNLPVLCTTPITSNGITASQFEEPLNTGANMTIPMPEGMLNQFEGGQIAAFYGDLCVGLETISGGFMSMGLWGVLSH